MKNEYLLMASDEDAQVYATIVMGNDECGDLVIQLEEHDEGWDYPEGACHVSCRKTTATVDADNLKMMASHLKISKEGVMNRLMEEFGGNGYISSPFYVCACFKEILEYVLDCGAKYKLKR